MDSRGGKQRTIKRRLGSISINIDNSSIKSRLGLKPESDRQASSSSHSNSPSNNYGKAKRKKKSPKDRHHRSRDRSPSRTGDRNAVSGASAINPVSEPSGRTNDLREHLATKNNDSNVENNTASVITGVGTSSRLKDLRPSVMPLLAEASTKIDLLEGTIVEFHETYGFILVDATVVKLEEVYKLIENSNGRLWFKLPQEKAVTFASKFKRNDRVTFSLEIYAQLPEDGQHKYAVNDVAQIFKRTDDQIYAVSSRKRKIEETDDPTTSSDAKDAKRSKKSLPTMQVEGVIKGWRRDKMCCFVRPLDKLPEEVFKTGEFFLHLSNLSALDMDLVFGDGVQIVVNPNQADRMRADRGILTSLTHKGHSDVNKVVSKVLVFLTEADKDEKLIVSQLYDPNPLLALLKYFLTHQRKTHSEEMNTLFAIMRILQICQSKCSIVFTKQVLKNATDSSLFKRGGPFSKLFASSLNPVLKLSDVFSEDSDYIVPYNSQTSPLSIDEVFKILLNCVETFPECSRKIHNLISSRLSLCNPEILLGFMRVLSQPYAKREDTTHRELKLVPTNEELEKFILSENGHLDMSNLRPVTQSGPYESAESYIETYFNLLRYDCFYNFLTGLKKYANGKHDSRDISVFKNGYLLGIGMDKQSAAITFTVAASLETKLLKAKIRIERLVQF